MNSFLMKSLIKDNIILPGFMVIPFSSLFDSVRKASKKKVRYQNIKSLYINLHDFFTGASHGRPAVKDIFLTYEFIHNLKCSLPAVNAKKCIKILEMLLNESLCQKYIDPVMKDIHFVWLGPLNPNTCDFLKFWKKVNPDYTVHLWIDKKILKSGINGRMRKKHINTISVSELQTAFRTASYLYLPPPYRRKKPLRTSFIHSAFHPVLLSAKSATPEPTDGIITHDVSEVFNRFFARHFLKIYTFEVFCRKNFAAASDVFRLLLLYHRGGFYIDTDTLPGLLHYSKKFRDVVLSHIPHEDYDCREKLDVGMTNESLSLLKSCGDFAHTDFKDTAYTSFISIKDNYIQCSDIGCYPLFNKLENLKIPDGNFLIARDPIRETVFFSNFIFSSPQNEFTKNALFLLERNYQKLGLFNLISPAGMNDMLSEEFTEYFFDGFLNNSLKTLYISGPGVLINAGIINLIETYDLPSDFNRYVLLNILWKIWGTSHHSINNATGFQSAWRDKDNI